MGRRFNSVGRLQDLFLSSAQPPPVINSRIATPTYKAPMNTFELRQQLSADHLMALNKAVDFKLAHLNNFLREVSAITSNKEVFGSIHNEMQLLEDAKSQVGRLFYDQFPEGRKSNDEHGHRGLQLPGSVLASSATTETPV